MSSTSAASTALTSGACPHPALVEVEGLHGFYRCTVCGLVFNLVLTTAHTARDCRAMAYWFAKLGGPTPPGERYEHEAEREDDP